MKIFLDANILISVLNNEYPLFTYSSRILSLIDQKKFKVYTSPLCLGIAFYFAEKKSGRKLAKKKMAILAEKIGIAKMDDTTVRKAAKSKIDDFEDALQYYAAIEMGCKHIITENAEDFFFSEIEVINSKSFVEKYLI